MIKQFRQKTKFQKDLFRYNVKQGTRRASKQFEHVRKFPPVQRILGWFSKLFKRGVKRQNETLEIAYQPTRISSGGGWRRTKAYADQRQKAPKNRKKKASKRIRNTYKHIGRYQ